MQRTSTLFELSSSPRSETTTGKVARRTVAVISRARDGLGKNQCLVPQASAAKAPATTTSFQAPRLNFAGGRRLAATSRTRLGSRLGGEAVTATTTLVGSTAVLISVESSVIEL